jgi:hypothetical protein
MSVDEERPEPVVSGNVPTSNPQRRTQVKTREFERAPPIQMLRGKEQYNLEEVLQSIQPEISLAQLLDASATLRQQLYSLLRSIIPRTRRRTYKAPDAVGAVQIQPSIPPAVTSRAKDDDGDAEAMYIDAWVGDTKITDILVDGGSMVDLIGTQIAQLLDLPLHRTADMGIRLADDTLISLDHYVWLDINVGGILARLKVYVVPVIQTYTILLSRRWLRRVSAVEHHTENKLTIYGSDGKAREIHPSKRQVMGTTLAASIHIPEVVLNGRSDTGGHGITDGHGGVDGGGRGITAGHGISSGHNIDSQILDDEASTAMEIILDELDNWITGNV